MQISVLIPNYNNAQYLSRCFESAITAVRGYRAEIIFLDDGSTDNSLEIASRYSDNINIYKNEKNLGQVEATNKVLRLSKGQYAVLLHSDDLLMEHFFSCLLPLISSNQKIVMAVGEREEINASDELIVANNPFWEHDCIINGLKHSETFLFTGYLPCQVLFDRVKVLAYGGAEKGITVNLDGLLWFKASFFGDIAYTRQVVAHYRRHSASATSNLNTSVQHIFDYATTISRMFLFADEMGHSLSSFKNKAFKRMAEISLRYAREIFYAKNNSLSRSYIEISRAIDPSINNNSDYNELINAMKDGTSLNSGYWKRNYSFKVPEGSIILRDKNESI
jgi:glycosyltransferase involved in cell wall biosynthesis